MTRGLGTLLLVASFLLGTTVLGQKQVPAKGFSLGVATTANTVAVGGLPCSCSCGQNCDGSCVGDFGTCVFLDDALACHLDCCRNAPKPGPGECE